MVNYAWDMTETACGGARRGGLYALMVHSRINAYSASRSPCAA